MTTKYFALLTNQGAAKLTNAAALGTKVDISSIAVGDGGGTLPTPDATQTKLIGEKRRAPLNSLTVDAANSSQIIAEQIIPESEGGFWIREIGLFDADGVMIAVANCAETYKPQLAEGSGRTQTVRMILIVNSTSAVTLKIDPAVVLATRQYVDNAVIEVKAYADQLMEAHVKAVDPHTQYAPKASPTLTGTPKAPTPGATKNDTQIATTAFVQTAIGLLKGDAPAALDTLAELAAAINNDPNFYQTMASQLVLKAAIASPTFTGTPKAPTATAGNNSTQLATTQFVQFAIAQLVASSPAALDTLNELAAALGNDPNFATTMTNQLAARALLAGNVNQQFSVKDATLDGHAVNRGQMNTALTLRALLNGSASQKFLVLSSPGDNNAAVPVSLLNAGLNQKAGLNGHADQAFQMSNSGAGSCGVNNDRLNFVLQSYAALNGNQFTQFSVGGATAGAHAVRLDQFQSGSNGNGAWTKMPGGGQWCRQNMSIPAKTNVIWTYPAAFPAAPAVFITGINGDPAVWSTGVGAGNTGIYNNNDSALNVNLLAIW